VLRETNTAITTYGNALDVLTQQCRDLICRDTWAAVHGVADKVDHISEDVRRALDGVHLVEDAIRHALSSIDDIKDGVSAIGEDGLHTVMTCPKQLPCRPKGHPWPARLCRWCWIRHHQALFRRHESRYPGGHCRLDQ